MSSRTGYSITGYGEMIMDGPRMDAYVRALQQAVHPGCTVLDIGTGTGIFSLLSCRFGAGRVHAVEPDDVIEIARAMAADNGCRERITFHQKLSTEVVFAKKADIVISDLRGILPLYQAHIPAIVDARQRLLVAGGMMIPGKDTLWAALAETPDLYKSCLEPWRRNDFGLDLHAGQLFAVNSFRKTNLKPHQILVEPRCWATLDYQSIQDPNVRGDLAWKIENRATAHGVVAWFDTELAEGIGFSNAPGQPDLIYGQAFFPWTEPVELEEGDNVTVHIRADLLGDDYSWKWDTRIVSGREPQTVKADFKQSTFYGQPITSASLRKKGSVFIPDLEEKGRVDLFILDLMNGERTLEEIARQASARFPQRYRDWLAALTRVGELSQKYSR